jgi:hypothetical protein
MVGKYLAEGQVVPVKAVDAALLYFFGADFGSDHGVFVLDGLEVRKNNGDRFKSAAGRGDRRPGAAAGAIKGIYKSKVEEKSLGRQVLFWGGVEDLPVYGLRTSLPLPS